MRITQTKPGTDRANWTHTRLMPAVFRAGLTVSDRADKIKTGYGAGPAMAPAGIAPRERGAPAALLR